MGQPPGGRPASPALSACRRTCGGTVMEMEPEYRIEHDSMGEMRVPRDALYGAQTARAVENFPISRMRFQRPFLRALGLIKAAAAQANGRMGHLPQAKAAAIEAPAVAPQPT